MKAVLKWKTLVGHCTVSHSRLCLLFLFYNIVHIFPQGEDISYGLGSYWWSTKYNTTRSSCNGLNSNGNQITSLCSQCYDWYEKSFHCGHLMYSVSSLLSFEETDRLCKERSAMPRLSTLVHMMCVQISICSSKPTRRKVHRTTDAPDLMEFRLVDMFTSVTDPAHKDYIIQAFTKESHLKTINYCYNCIWYGAQLS